MLLLWCLFSHQKAVQELGSCLYALVYSVCNNYVGPISLRDRLRIVRIRIVDYEGICLNDSGWKPVVWIGNCIAKLLISINLLSGFLFHSNGFFCYDEDD